MYSIKGEPKADSMPGVIVKFDVVHIYCFCKLFRTPAFSDEFSEHLHIVKVHHIYLTQLVLGGEKHHGIAYREIIYPDNVKPCRNAFRQSEVNGICVMNIHHVIERQ